jgi:hypothetical protein
VRLAGLAVLKTGWRVDVDVDVVRFGVVDVAAY